MKPESPERQLAGFLAKYTPEVAAMARELRAKLRKRMPGAIELVYDNYNALVIGFGPTERPSEAIFSLAVMPRWVSLCFLQAAKVRDPNKLLRGEGTVARHIRLESAAAFDKPEVQDLIASALECATVPMNSTSRHKLIIRSISAKQRPRRPTDKTAKK